MQNRFCGSSLWALFLLLSVLLGAASAAITFTNPPSTRTNAFNNHDLLDISWTGGSPENYGLVLHQDQGGNEVQYFITFKNASLGASGNSFIWPIDIGAFGDRGKFKYDQGDETTFSLRMYASTQDPAILAQTANFAIQKPAEDEGPAIWYREQRIDLHGGSQNEICDNLTPGAKAGIGIGVVVAVILLGLNTAWFILSTKRKHQAQQALEAHQLQQQQQMIPPAIPNPQLFAPLSIPPPPPFFPGPPLPTSIYGNDQNHSYTNIAPVVNRPPPRDIDTDSKREPAELPGNGD